MDEYNLINSKAIREHCRKINHKFNTEELAVLIYRNKRMDVTEKIEAYQELIANYPDMEVIERINCKHYDSVKVMIQDEIKRIRDLTEKLEQEEPDVVYTYNYWCNSKYRGIIEGKDEYRDLYQTFQEVQEAVNGEIEQDEDKEIRSFRIRKRQFSRDSKYNIGAEYKLNDDRKLEMVNIYDFNGEWLDISNICLNLPTPFQKGDLLLGTSKTPFAEGYVLTYDKYPFVLEHLCTWRENFQKLLDKGNFDSSDMQGWGYMISEEGNLYLDNNHDYDNWEYFDGELHGMERILKATSSLLKDEIDLSLFIQAYEKMREESQCVYLDTFTEKGLELCGFSQEDIIQIKGK